MILDSDGSHNPNNIPEINKKFDEGNYDIVIGSRYIKGGETNDKKTSVVMSKMLNLAFRICLGIKAHDISTDFRMYDTQQLKNVKLDNKNYDVLQEVLLKMKLNNPSLKIGEIPIVFNKRVYGESKRNLLPFIIDYIKSLFKLTIMRFPALWNLLVYGIFGVCGALIEYSFFYLLTQYKIVEKVELANIIAALVGFIFTFSMNTFLNFKKKDKLFRRLLSYGSVCVCGIAFSTLMIYLLKPFANLYLLKLGLMIIVSIMQFILNKFITYR